MARKLLSQPYAFSRDLEVALRARNFPLRVHYGPEPNAQDALSRNRIVIERDRGAGDTDVAPRGVQRNPRREAMRMLGLEVHVYARATVNGARVEDHEALCDIFVDALVVAIREWGEAARAGSIPITSARYLSSEERNGVQTWPGVVYRMTLQLPRGITALDYQGGGQPTGAPSGVQSRTDVRLTGHDDAPVTGCGG